MRWALSTTPTTSATSNSCASIGSTSTINPIGSTPSRDSTTRPPTSKSTTGDRRYGDLAALSDVSFDIASGEIVGLLGPNGAGKTTLIRVLTGYYEPTAGSIRIDGLDVEADSIGVQQRIGYLPERHC